jgi:hypothetical protein
LDKEAPLDVRPIEETKTAPLKETKDDGMKIKDQKIESKNDTIMPLEGPLKEKNLEKKLPNEVEPIDN